MARRRWIQKRIQNSKRANVLTCKRARNINPSSLNCDENADLSKLGVFDHLTPKTQEFFFEAKKFKNQESEPILLDKEFISLP